MDFTSIFRRFQLLLTTYFVTITSIFLLINTIGIINNGNALTDERNEIEYLEKKYNELQQLYVYL